MYTKTTWTEGVTGLSAENLLNLETQYDKAVADIAPATKEFFVPVTGVGNAGVYAGYLYTLSAPAQYARLLARLPADFLTLTAAKIVLYATGTGTFDWTCNTSWGTIGEHHDGTTDTATADGQAVTDQHILELDVSAAFTGVAALDTIKITFILDALATTTAINVLGINFKYA